jgi:hypothetical protein
MSFCIKYVKEEKMKRLRMFVLVVLTAVAIWGLILPVSGEEKAKEESASTEVKGFTIARAVIGTGVEDREPVGVAEIFPASTEKVYCFIEATNIAEDAEVTLVWLHDGNEMSKFNLTLKTGARWRTWAYKNLRELKGDWKVEIKDASGNLLKELTFKVE